MYEPSFVYTDAMVNDLLTIERCRAQLELLPLTHASARDLAEATKARRTHYSTSIEGNALLLGQVEEVIKGKAHGARLSAEQEVINYWDALTFLESAAEDGRDLSEELIKELHAIITRKDGRQRTRTVSITRVRADLSEEDIRAVAALVVPILPHRVIKVYYMRTAVVPVLRRLRAAPAACAYAYDSSDDKNIMSAAPRSLYDIGSERDDNGCQRRLTQRYLPARCPPGGRVAYIDYAKAMGLMKKLLVPYWIGMVVYAALTGAELSPDQYHLNLFSTGHLPYRIITLVVTVASLTAASAYLRPHVRLFSPHKHS